MSRKVSSLLPSYEAIGTTTGSIRGNSVAWRNMSFIISLIVSYSPSSSSLSSDGEKYISVISIYFVISVYFFRSLWLSICRFSPGSFNSAITSMNATLGPFSKSVCFSNKSKLDCIAFMICFDTWKFHCYLLLSVLFHELILWLIILTKPSTYLTYAGQRSARNASSSISRFSASISANSSGSSSSSSSAGESTSSPVKKMLLSVLLTTYLFFF